MILHRYLACAALSVALHSLPMYAMLPIKISTSPVDISLNTRSPNPAFNIQLMPSLAKIETKQAEKKKASVKKSLEKQVSQENIEKKTPLLEKNTPIKKQEKKKTEKASSVKEEKSTLLKEKPKQQAKKKKILKQEATRQKDTEQKKTGQQAARQHIPKQIEKPQFKVQPVAPKYPRIAKRKGLQGTALIEIWIDENGLQIKQVLIKSTGALVLDEAAMNAIKQWHFVAYKEEGKALAHRIQVPVRFNLDAA